MYPNMVPGEQKENAHFRYRGPVKAPVDMRIPVGPKSYEFFAHITVNSWWPVEFCPSPFNLFAPHLLTWMYRLDRQCHEIGWPNDRYRGLIFMGMLPR